MQAIHFRGAYRYDSHAALERALAAARIQLDDEDELDPIPPRSFVRSGTSLIVDVLVPNAVEIRFVAANVLQELAREAIEGAVEACHGADQVDYFASGDDD